MPLVVMNVKETNEEAEAVLAALLGIPREHLLRVEVMRRSLDARPRQPVWRTNYCVEVTDEASLLARRIPGVRPYTERDRQRQEGLVPPVQTQKRQPVVVVGAGPAGLFAALRLGEAGTPVVLLERGGPVDARVSAVNGFWRRSQPIDPENNLLFGEGGAGTFSDGKIYTRRRDGELGYIFRILVEAGADPGIMTDAYAHLGTDKVRAILPALRERLRAAGVEFRFHARAEHLQVQDGRCVGVMLADGEVLAASRVMVAAGHSARDTMAMLLDAGAAADLRPIAIGARVEHPQVLIDTARYGAGRGDLPPASYRLADNPPKGRSAYTFCMCPGGMVVPAMERAGLVVVNGMSFAARRAVWANSAVIVQVYPADYGASDPMAGVRFQAAIEAKAFTMGGANYTAPAQRVGDFLKGEPSADLPRVSYPMGVVSADLTTLLPEAVVAGMRRALKQFDKEIKGFGSNEGVLIAPETRTTAPLRFLRGADLQSTSLPGLMPVGEGAGFAGGIISAALDGWRAAEAVLQGA